MGKRTISVVLLAMLGLLALMTLCLCRLKADLIRVEAEIQAVLQACETAVDGHRLNIRAGVYPNRLEDVDVTLGSGFILDFALIIENAYIKTNGLDYIDKVFSSEMTVR